MGVEDLKWHARPGHTQPRHADMIISVHAEIISPVTAAWTCQTACKLYLYKSCRCTLEWRLLVTSNLRTIHRRPTSREWAQLCVPIPLWRQLINRVSFPMHLVSSMSTGPVATPNPLAVAFKITLAPVYNQDAYTGLYIYNVQEAVFWHRNHLKVHVSIPN